MGLGGAAFGGDAMHGAWTSCPVCIPTPTLIRARIGACTRLVLVDHLPNVQAVTSMPYICLACRRRVTRDGQTYIL
jgi:hypothetical protein